MLLKGNPPPKLYSYGNILPRNYVSYIFEFQLVPFDFSLTLGDPFMVSPSPLKYEEGGLFSEKTLFMGGDNFVWKIYRRIVLHEGTNDEGEGVSQNIFPSHLNTVNLKIFCQPVEDSLEYKALVIL